MFLFLLWFVMTLMWSYWAFEEYKKDDRPTGRFWLYLILVAAGVSFMFRGTVC